MKNKVIVIGSLNYDICLKQKSLPKEGETCFADSVDYCSGGKGANQAVQAAKLGVPTYMVGCVGGDYMGSFLLESLQSYHVDTSFVKVVRADTGMAVAQSLYDGGVRASVVRGANDFVEKKDIDALESFISPGDIAVFQLEIPVTVIEYAMRFCKERGCIIVLNGAPALPVEKKMIQMADIFIVNEVEAEFFTGEVCSDFEKASRSIERAAENLGNACIFTLGKEGSLVRADGMTRHISAKKVNAVESTGAGDAFVGGICYGLLQGKDLFSAAEFATLCSAVTVQKTGGQPAMPTLDQLRKG